MKHQALFPLASLAACFDARAAEQLLFWQNGVEVQAVYARGTEAPALITKHLAATQRAADGTPAAWTSHDDWRVLAGVEGTVSRVLQVRGEGDALEAISSELDTRRPVRPHTPPPLWLPPASLVTSDVQFSRPSASRQWVSRSAWSIASTASWLRLSARIQGWAVEPRSAPFSLLLSRQRERLGVVLLPRDGGPSGSIAVLTSWSSP